MISHPSEFYENYTPGADTTSKADYQNVVLWVEDPEPEVTA